MKPRSDRSLWLGVGLAFALLLGAWALLFTIAAEHPVESVPLATATPQTADN